MKSRRQKSDAKTKDQSKKNGKRRWLPVFCRVTGLLMLLVVIALSAPLAVPHLMGYEVYDVVSGSMEPEIPVGSVLYVKPVDPSSVKEDEVIAYFDSDGETVVAHRVVYNRTTLGEFVTKGDANNTEDRDPIPYDAVIGRVESHFPYVGKFMSIYSTNVGKIYLLLAAACGVMLNMLSERIREAQRIRAAIDEVEAEAEANAKPNAKAPPKSK